MAATAYDMKSLGAFGGMSETTSQESVQDSAVQAGGSGASIKSGQIVQYANGYWSLVADGGCNVDGTYGLAQSDSTETATEDGLVKVMRVPGGVLKIRGAATTPGNFAQAILGDKVTIDVSGGVQTIDENDPNGVLQIVGYDSDTGLIDVLLPTSQEA